MKPLLLSFSGLNSYREKQTIDFEALGSTGLFGIFGPTGAGKSTILDAITLALFGDVDRNKKARGALVNLYEKRCEVDFLFSLRGHVYRAQRVLEQDKGNPLSASTDNCRLYDQDNDLVLASKAKEMDQKIQRLLGLDFDHFSQAVVLPQGKFDTFLRLTPAKRGDVLEQLFHLNEYGNRLEEVARAKKNGLQQELEGCRIKKEMLGDCSKEKIDGLQQKLEQAEIELQELEINKEKAQKRFAECEQFAKKTNELEKSRQSLGQLKQLEAAVEQKEEALVKNQKAAGIKDIIDQAFAAYNQAKDAKEQLEEVRKQFVTLQTYFTQGEVPPGLAIVREIDDILRPLLKNEQVLQEEKNKLENKWNNAKEKIIALDEKYKRDFESWKQKEAALRSLQESQMAAFLASSLQPFKPCPVCGSLEHPAPVTVSADLPDFQVEKEEVEALQKSWEKSKKDLDENNYFLQKIQAEIDIVKEKLNLAQKERQCFCDERKNHVEKQLVQMESQYNTLQKNADVLKETSCARALEQGFSSVNEAKKAVLDEESFKRLAQEITDYRSRQKGLQADVERLEKELCDAQYQAQDLQAARENLDTLQKRWQQLIEEKTVSQKDLEQLKKNQDVYRQILEQEKVLQHQLDLTLHLLKLLQGRAFVRFLAAESLRELVYTASITLGYLSNQRYQLELFEENNGSDFIMVDHYYGGQKRLVSTLSGGEIFLVSLALALALSAKIQMQGAPLEFFFLDEGFGTLDSDKLEMVMTTLERLPSNNRMVGIISHVAEIKGRLPKYLEVIPANEEHGSMIRMGSN